MATLYIPYVVGSSAIAYIGKEIVSYLYKEEKLEDLEKNETTNSFLKKENMDTDNSVFDIIEDDCVDREYKLNDDVKEDNDIIAFPELKENSDNLENKIEIPKVKNVSFKLDPKFDIPSFKPILDIIKEEETDSIELSSKPLLTSKLHKCKKCNIFLPLKCFSKTQKKKLPTNWTCKVCLKLN